MFDPNDREQFEEITTDDGPGIYLRLPDLEYRSYSGQMRRSSSMIIFPVETSLIAIATQTDGENITRSAVIVPIDQWEKLRDAVDERIGFMRDYAQKYAERKKQHDR